MPAIAPWFCLSLASCGPGFKSQALHLHFFQFVIDLWCEKDENKRKKRPGLAHIFKKIKFYGDKIIAISYGLKCPDTDSIFQADQIWSRYAHRYQDNKETQNHDKRFSQKRRWQSAGVDKIKNGVKDKSKGGTSPKKFFSISRTFWRHYLQSKRLST